jgi:hypothetical protein
MISPEAFGEAASGDAAQVGSNLAKGDKLVKQFWIAPIYYIN